MAFDVVVVGAGPTGLMQACELSLAGVRSVVLERRPEPSGLPKANGLAGQIVQVLDYRGLLERFSAESSYTGPMPGFPFGSVPLRFSELDASPLLGVLVSQPRMEAVLSERARELGVEIRRGHEMRALFHDDDGVTLDVAGPDGGYRLRTGYLVGCDGGHSQVREQAGIGFPGTSDGEVLRLGHFRATDAVGPFDNPEIDLPGVGRLQPGWNRTPRGRVLVMSLQPGVHIVGVREKTGKSQAPVALDTPVTLAEFRAGVRRVLGADLPLGEPLWLSQTVSQARLADRYRAGRVLLAGDAAHLFPAGGSSLNVGLMDTVNLGWKLAAHIQGWAPANLLDSYHTERHPAAVRALMQTRAQAVLDGTPGPDGTALRELFTELVAYDPPLRHLGAMLQGSDIRYEMPGNGPHPHPLLGSLAPDLRLTTIEGPTRVAELMRTARPLLLDLADRRAGTHGWTDRINHVTARCDDPPADALLIRPDGYVAWAAATDEPHRPARQRLDNALATWFGTVE